MFRKRLLAIIIDFLIFCFLFFILTVISILDEKNSLFNQTGYIIFAVLLLSVWLGFIFKDAFYGQSIGKRLVHIKVISKDGKKPNLFQVFLRNITIHIWPIELIMLFLDKERIGDILAKTKIIEE